MKLILSKKDLKPEHKENINPIMVTFEHFNDGVQQKIVLLGSAYFESGDFDKFIACPPKQKIKI